MDPTEAWLADISKRRHARKFREL